MVLFFLNCVTLLLAFELVGCSPTAGSDDSSTMQNAPGATDTRLIPLIQENSLSPLTTPSAESSDLVFLGETLFSEVALSGARDISCMSCHSTSLGTTDGLPFSIGTGASGITNSRQQVNGVSLPTTRNAPSLYNLGRNTQSFAFLDGRVSLSSGIISSAVAEISGRTPTRRDIASVFTNVFDIQPLFPILTSNEMLGTGNDLALHSNNIDIWNSILQDRLLTQSHYATLFAKAFPTVAKTSLNIGHVGRALGAFMKIKFQSNQSGFDRYLEGDLTALSESQKRGMLVFYTRGQCFRCHQGTELTDNQFHSSGVPQVGFLPFSDDLGLAGTTGLAGDRYKFKTPGLRNVGLSAPYMHDGAFQTLEEVIDHYSNVEGNLTSYRLPASYQNNYQMTLSLDTNATRNAQRLNQIDNRAVRNGLNLSAQEKADLTEFLRNGLRDPNFN